MKVVIDTHGILNAVSSHSPNKWLYDAYQCNFCYSVSTKADTSELKAEIDRMVYELYELTEEEILIVEGK